MPFARVGVLPQPNSNSQNNMNRKTGSANSNRHRGITMEDLKRQTAIRLAQEQKQHGRGFEEPLNQPNSRYAVDGIQNQGYPHNRFPQGESSRDQFHYSGREVQPQHRPQTYTPSYQPHYYQAHQHQSQGYRMAGYESHAAHQHSPNGAPMYQDDPSWYRNKNPQAQEMTNSNATGGYRFRYNSDPFPSKLTHGLTVQELKQMTKARLQAEAAEKQDTDRLSPLDFDSSVHEQRDRTFSRDSSGFASAGVHQINPSESTNSVPSLVHMGMGNQTPSRQRQTPPAKSIGINGFNSGNDPSTYSLVSPSWDAGTQMNSKADGIDTASTNSFNNSVLSENLGSDSAFSGGMSTGMPAQTENDFASIPFNRSSSYKSSTKSNDPRSSEAKSTSSSTTASPASNANSYSFEATVGGNRRRAATLSPNPISIMEGQPHFAGQNLALPNFGSAGRVSLLARSRANSSSAVLPSDLSDNGLLTQPTGLFSFDDVPIRARTESSVSLPPMSHTADEFEVDRILNHHIASNGREGPATGNVGQSLMNQGENGMPAPPGFALQSGFASSLGPNALSAGVDSLASEMGSILSLSGDGGNRERLNTYPLSSKAQAPEYISEEFFTKDTGDFGF